MSEFEWFDPNKLAGIRARLSVLGRRSSKLAKEAQEISNEINEISIDLLTDPETNLGGTLKREDGRLNEAGARAVDAAFEAGATVTVVAKDFGISVSAASVRRKLWRASKGSGQEKAPARKPPRSRKK